MILIKDSDIKSPKERDEHFKCSLMTDREWRAGLEAWMLKRAYGIRGVSIFLDQEGFDSEYSPHIIEWLRESQQSSGSAAAGRLTAPPLSRCSGHGPQADRAEPGAPVLRRHFQRQPGRKPGTVR